MLELRIARDVVHELKMGRDGADLREQVAGAWHAAGLPRFTGPTVKVSVTIHCSRPTDPELLLPAAQPVVEALRAAILPNFARLLPEGAEVLLSVAQSREATGFEDWTLIVIEEEERAVQPPEAGRRVKSFRAVGTT
jgi:hypothetical protein